MSSGFIAIFVVTKCCLFAVHVAVVVAGASGSLSSSHRVEPPDRGAPAAPTAPTASHNSIANSGTGKGVNAGVLPNAPHQSLVLVVTDVCFKALPKDLLPIALPLMVQLDIPQSKVCMASIIAFDAQAPACILWFALRPRCASVMNLHGHTRLSHSTTYTLHRKYSNAA